MPYVNKFKNNGFSLLELLLALGILGIITAFAISISYSSKSIVKTSDTKKKMQQIARAAKEYYRGHKDLPAPAGANKDEVPIGSADLSLEQTSRLDGWGRYFHYNRVLDATLSSRTDIVGITVNGRDVAGVIVSGGPDQAIDPNNLSSPYATTGDDIVLGINLSEQALDIALNDLQVLQSKAQAFDKIFAGIDNNSNETVDESDCDRAMGCPPSLITNDPNCGSATLDNISTFMCGYVITSATAFIVDFYALNSAILLDPWLNEYVWGSVSGNIRYHKFYSAGPDSNTGTDDDIIQ
jgi:prepilin-type N-terminal cleavage/methylation domain-containing protein